MVLHVQYQEVWEPCIGEEISVLHESGNTHGRHTMHVYQSELSRQSDCKGLHFAACYLQQQNLQKLLQCLAAHEQFPPCCLPAADCLLQAAVAHAKSALSNSYTMPTVPGFIVSDT